MRALFWVCVTCCLLEGCRSKPVAPRYPLRSCTTTISWDAGPNVPNSVVGEWSGFASPGSPLVAQPDGTLGATLTLDARDYGYDFIGTDGGSFWDPANPYTRWVGGVEHSRLTVPDCKSPLIELQSFRITDAGMLDVSARYVDGSLAAGPDAQSAQVTLDGTAQSGAFNPAAGQFSLHLTQLAAGKHAVTLAVADAAGRAALPIYLPFWVEPAPFDWRDAVLYFAFTDRFRDGNPANDSPVSGVQPQANYEGGDWAGIAQAIQEGYFDQLGVNAIWISPVDANPDTGFPGSYSQNYSGYHGYWPSQARTPQPRFGSLTDLRGMVAVAHQHGIRVLGDLVVNHVHQDHPYYQQHKNDGWFATSNVCICGAPGCDWTARGLDCWFAPYLPTYDWRTQAMSDQFVSDALYWIENADLDGFRVDAVKQVEQVAIRTIAGRLHDIARQTGIRYYLVGETFGGSTDQPLVAKFIGPTQLDGQFDFPLHWPVVDAFANAGPLTALDQAVIYDEGYYPPGTLNSPFLGNADVPRFISIADGVIGSDPSGQAWTNPPPPAVTADQSYRRAKYAFAFLLSQPGVPLIYYGDEVGLPGAGDPDNRRLMPWGPALTSQQSDLLTFVRALGQARAHNPGLRRGVRTTLAAETDFYLYERDDSGGQGAVVAINRAPNARTIAANLGGGLQSVSGTWHDALGGPAATIASGAFSAQVPAQSAALYIPGP